MHSGRIALLSAFLQKQVPTGAQFATYLVPVLQQLVPTPSLSSRDQLPMTWKDLAPFALFDDATWPERGAILMEQPAGEIVARSADEVAGALENLDRAVADGLHVAGYFSYELGYCFEPRLRRLAPETSRPLLRFGIFGRQTPLNARERNRWLVGLGFPDTVAIATSEAISLESYERQFSHVHDLIGQGDVYQVNLTFKVRTQPVADVSSLYQRLRTRARAGGSAFLHYADEDILSFSPETFFVTSGRRIHVRPMKGTTGRHPQPALDWQRVTDLQNDPKQRAENLMIVDLMRNDLSRLCVPGSVRVDDMFTVETYPTYHTLTSTVVGELASEPRFASIIPALFPCGSVTGAPKIRAMEIIRETESEPRGVYCGAVGFASGSQKSFNVAIRTLALDERGGELGIGGGIVWDSSAGGELEEARLKARFFTDVVEPFRLIETMRWEPGEGFYLLDRHLRRLAQSAAHFGYRLDPQSVLRHLLQSVSGKTAVQRVRLTLGARGDTQIETADPEPAPNGWGFVVSPDTVSSMDWRLHHKSTSREPYAALDRIKPLHPEVDEVILVNERGELTEGCRSTLFIERDGLWLTPPLSAGLLDGCLRREMLENGPQRTIESILTPRDLETGTVWFGNALRGLIRGRRVAL
jgi:para-aminobenzoate synthetase / 4-amino-4-deoxychorismate lyase